MNTTPRVKTRILEQGDSRARGRDRFFLTPVAMRLMRQVLLCTNLCSQISKEGAESGGINPDRQSCVSVVVPLAGHRFINVSDRYLTQRVVVPKEPPQKVFDIPMPSLNGSF
jgi:hypothetical protein